MAHVVFSAFLLIGCSKRDAATGASSPAPQILRLSQRNEPADLDPATASLPDEFSLLRALGEGLLIPGPNGTAPQPGAAERFDVSADGLTYTFHLRENLRWSNGESLSANDFVASYRRALTPATAAPKANVFYPVKNARAFVSGELGDFGQVGFRATDTRTLIIALEQPAPRFPYYVASGPWIPVNPRVVERHGRTWTRPGNFVGNGPFTLAEWQPHQRIVVRKNPKWHGASNVQLAEIHFVHFDNADAEDRAYRAGQIDVTMDVPKTKLELYARERAAELHRLPMIETRHLAFNTRRPPLDDARVRRALSLAIDRQRIVERVLRGGQPVATRMLPPQLRDSGSMGGAGSPSRPSPSVNEAGSRALSRPNRETQPHQPDLAPRLLAAAGFVDGKNFPRLEVSAWSQSQVPVLEAVQAMWKQHLGIDVAIAIREAKVHIDALARGSYDIGFITAIPDVADAGNLLGDFTTGSPENYPQWSDHAFDREIEQALRIADEGLRTKRLHAAEDRLLEAAAVAPLYFNTKAWLMSPRVRGWHEDGLWTRCYQNVHLDEKQ